MEHCLYATNSVHSVTIASKGNGSPAVAEVLIRHNANVNAKSTDVGNSILAVSEKCV